MCHREARHENEERPERARAEIQPQHEQHVIQAFRQDVRESKHDVAKQRAGVGALGLHRRLALLQREHRARLSGDEPARHGALLGVETECERDRLFERETRPHHPLQGARVVQRPGKRSLQPNLRHGPVQRIHEVFLGQPGQLDLHEPDADRGSIQPQVDCMNEPLGELHEDGVIRGLHQLAQPVIFEWPARRAAHVDLQVDGQLPGRLNVHHDLGHVEQMRLARATHEQRPQAQEHERRPSSPRP